MRQVFARRGTTASLGLKRHTEAPMEQRQPTAFAPATLVTFATSARQRQAREQLVDVALPAQSAAIVLVDRRPRWCARVLEAPTVLHLAQRTESLAHRVHTALADRRPRWRARVLEAPTDLHRAQRMESLAHRVHTALADRRPRSSTSPRGTARHSWTSTPPRAGPGGATTRAGTPPRACARGLVSTAVATGAA